MPHPLDIAAVCTAGACVGLIVACGCKAVDDWWAAGAEKRAKDRRTDERAAAFLRQRRRPF